MPFLKLKHYCTVVQQLNIAIYIYIYIYTLGGYGIRGLERGRAFV